MYFHFCNYDFATIFSVILLCVYLNLDMEDVLICVAFVLALGLTADDSIFAANWQ